MKLTVLQQLVRALNEKLQSHNSEYRLFIDNNMDVFLSNTQHQIIQRDKLVVDDLSDLVDSFIRTEQSGM